MEKVVSDPLADADIARMLDRPAWTALTTRHAHLAEGGELARRYDPSIVPFAATLDDGAECLAALASLASPGETMLFLQAGPVALPSNLTATLEAAGVQMVAEDHLTGADDPRIAAMRDWLLHESLEDGTSADPVRVEAAQ